MLANKQSERGLGENHSSQWPNAIFATQVPFWQRLSLLFLICCVRKQYMPAPKPHISCMALVIRQYFVHDAPTHPREPIRPGLTGRRHHVAQQCLRSSAARGRARSASCSNSLSTGSPLGDWTRTHATASRLIFGECENAVEQRIGARAFRRLRSSRGRGNCYRCCCCCSCSCCCSSRCCSCCCSCCGSCGCCC